MTDTTRFVLKKEAEVEAPVQKKKKAESMDSLDSDADEIAEESEDSIFGDEYKESAAAIYYLEDTQKDNRIMQAGSKVKLQITDLQASEGSIISYATLL